MATKIWDPCYQNMASMFDDCETIQKRHKEHLAYYNATEQDCELVDLQPAQTWEKLKSHFRLNIKTYLGWKVYMLHTGAFASKPEYEEN